MIVDEDKVAFDWVGTLVANDGNHFLTYEMLEVLDRELPRFSLELKEAFDDKDRESIIYQLDLIKESSMYCQMPKLIRHIDGILDCIDDDKYWPTELEMGLAISLLNEVKSSVNCILVQRQRVEGIQ